MIAARAKERQIEAIKRGNQNRHDESPNVQIIGQREDNKHATKSNTEAAKTVGNTNAEYVRQAEKIEAATPELNGIGLN